MDPETSSGRRSFLSTMLSLPRRRESISTFSWVPAFAGMTVDLTQKKPPIIIEGFFISYQQSLLPLNQSLFDFGNGLARVQTLWTGVGAVHDGVAAEQTEWIIQIIQTFARRFITAVGNLTIGLQQDGRAQVPITVPPIAGARCLAAEAQNTFPKAVELFTFFRAL